LITTIILFTYIISTYMPNFSHAHMSQRSLNTCHIDTSSIVLKEDILNNLIQYIQYTTD